MEGLRKSHPWLGSYWQLMAAGRGKGDSSPGMRNLRGRPCPTTWLHTHAHTDSSKSTQCFGFFAFSNKQCMKLGGESKVDRGGMRKMAYNIYTCCMCCMYMYVYITHILYVVGMYVYIFLK